MATIWDQVLPRGTTAQIEYPYGVAGVLAAVPAALDIRWLAKLKPNDPDSAAVITKTLVASPGGITIVGGNTIQVQINQADSAAPAISATVGTVYVYIGLKIFIAGTPEVGYDLFGGTVPSTPLLVFSQGGVQAVS